jgi:hypothetical protein
MWILIWNWKRTNINIEFIFLRILAAMVGSPCGWFRL